MSSAVATKQTETSITFVKTFDAPRELVYETFVTPKHLQAWWMPKGCTMFYCTIDLKVGGEWRYGVTIDDSGAEHWVKAEYEEIVPGKRLVLSDHFTDKDGLVNNSLPGKRMIITFEDEGDGTAVTIETILATPELKEQLAKMGFVEGMTMALGNLTQLLGDLEG
jgi:uncharacterized protein YndB with AHSA1/START domain